MLALIVLWALVGWHGTPQRRRPFPSPTPPDPDPGPWPWWASKLAGVVGGVVGGFLFNQIWPAGPTTASSGLLFSHISLAQAVAAAAVTNVVAATSAVGALVGSRTSSGILPWLKKWCPTYGRWIWFCENCPSHL